MGWFKGKKNKGEASPEAPALEESPGEPIEHTAASTSKLVHASSLNNFSPYSAAEGAVPYGSKPSPGRYPYSPQPAAAAPYQAPQANGNANLSPVTVPPPSSHTESSEISVATPVTGDAASNGDASNSDSMVPGANGFFKSSKEPRGKGSFMQQQQQRILELEDEIVRLQQELSAANEARLQAEQDAEAKAVQIDDLSKQIAELTHVPKEDAEARAAEAQRSADDLHAALKAFREQSQSKLADTLRQNQELRYQVENYEAMCRTIGEVLRDYEWLQQCRIVTGDLDLGRLRKSMIKLWHSGKTRSVLPVLAMVLAFGPDDVQRCRSVISTAKQEADMVCYIPEIIEHNLEENMKRDAITIYIEAHKSQTEDTDIAMFLTDKFAEKHKGEWHCVVGEQYALSSCYESKVIKFKSGHRSVILWSN